MPKGSVPQTREKYNKDQMTPAMKRAGASTSGSYHRTGTDIYTGGEKRREKRVEYNYRPQVPTGVGDTQSFDYSTGQTTTYKKKSSKAKY